MIATHLMFINSICIFIGSVYEYKPMINHVNKKILTEQRKKMRKRLKEIQMKKRAKRAQKFKRNKIDEKRKINERNVLQKHHQTTRLA